jgi:hypothetical protein
MSPVIRVLELVGSAALLSERERFWIAKGTDLGWPLTNATKGGEFCEHSGRAEVLRIVASLRGGYTTKALGQHEPRTQVAGTVSVHTSEGALRFSVSFQE